MRARGINYDTGFIHGLISRESFEPEVVRRELTIIRDDLHCNAVRVLGGDPDRLETAATIAAELGLEVWYSPFVCDLTEAEMLDLLCDCAERAERVRRRGAEVVFVAGGELTLTNHGFLPGDTIEQRLELLNDPQTLRAAMREARRRLDAFLRMAVAAVRERFGGKVTYAAIHPLEGIDWEPFDFVSIDLYRTAEVADRIEIGVRHMVSRGKPVAITEFGCATYKGAADLGARAGEIIEWSDDGAPVRLDGAYVRDEAEQAACVRELLEIFETTGVDSTFVFTFAAHALPHRDGDPRDDLDLASYGIVKVLEGGGETYRGLGWEPKAAFAAVAEAYRV